MLAEVMDNGQLAITPSFLARLNLKPGDKLEIFEEQGRFYMENPSMAAYRRVASEVEGEAEKAGFHNEEDLMACLSKMRVASARGIAKKYANPNLIPSEEGAFERAMAEKLALTRN